MAAAKVLPQRAVGTAPLLEFHFLLSPRTGKVWLQPDPRPLQGAEVGMPGTTEVIISRGTTPLIAQVHLFLSACTKQVVRSCDSIASVLQGTSGSDVPSCQHPEKIWDTERGQGCHLYVRVSPICGSYAGLCQDWCCSHRGLRGIQRRVLSWEDHGL